MMSKIRPLADRIVVKAEEIEETTAGGIVLPGSTQKEKPSKGKVIAIGPGKCDNNGKVQPIQVKPGDRVLFGKYAGTNVELAHI
jgi:chaperonin GroES